MNEDIKTVKRGKTNGYSSAHLHAKRNRKRSEAEARKREHDTLSTAQKLAKAKSRRGESKREVARLSKLLAAQGSKVDAPKVVKPVNQEVAAVTPVKKATKKVAKRVTKK